MTSNIFLEKFISQEKAINVLDADYILASKRIMAGHKWSNNTIVNIFRPSPETVLCRNIPIVVGRDDQAKKLKLNKDNDDYVHMYYLELDRQIGMIATLIKKSIIDNRTVIILATDNEEKELRHLKLFREFVLENFQYRIFKYDKNSKLSTISEQVYVDPEIIDLCNYYIKFAEKNRKKSLFLEGEKGRRSYYSDLSKKELKKKLKKVGITDVSSDKAELIDYALAYLDND